MLFITKIKSATDQNKTIYSIIYNSLRKIINSMDEIKLYEGIEREYYQYMIDINNLLKNLLDVSTLCTHNLIYIVNKLWVIINRLGTEIRMVQGSKNSKYNLLFTSTQNEYFTIFLELNKLINHEIKNLEKSKYKEKDIMNLFTGAEAAATIINNISEKAFEAPPRCVSGGDGDRGDGEGGDAEIDSDDSWDNIEFSDAGISPRSEPTTPHDLSHISSSQTNIFIKDAVRKTPQSSPSGGSNSRKKIVPLGEDIFEPNPPCLKTMSANYLMETIYEDEIRVQRTPVATSRLCYTTEFSPAPPPHSQQSYKSSFCTIT